MALEPGTILGSYRIDGVVCEGRTAVVYKATHLVLHSSHAIKVLSTALAELEEVRLRFLDEGRIQARFRHPHITPVTDLISSPGVAGLVMPLLSGMGLDDKLHQGPVPLDEGLVWFKQALSALSCVHKQGLVHQDLKPANIFVEELPDGTTSAKVMDSGIARISHLDRTRTGMDTPNYMSPEQIRSPKTVDARTDIFAMGTILYEMVTGQRAFDAVTAPNIQFCIISGEYTPVRDLNASVPEALCTVIETAMSRDMTNRFASAADFSAALTRASLQPSRQQRRPSPKRRTVVETPQPSSLQREQLSAEEMAERGLKRQEAGDDTEAVRWYRLAAEQGNAEAQSNLGVMYGNGQGVGQDDAEAVRWYRLAAEQGHAHAQNNLGFMYRDGRGVGQDYAEAARLYRLAAEQGHVVAQAVLGWMYDNGRGVGRDAAEAVRWYRLGAEQRHADAQNNLGFMYDNGRGVEQDAAEAARWYRLAAEQGQVNAQKVLGFMSMNGQGVEQDDAEAVRWFRLAAEQGLAAAQYALGWMYEKGRGIRQDDAEAVRWYRLAAEQGQVNAQKSLGFMSMNGRGVEQDDAEAVRLYRLAAEQGLAVAQYALGWMYNNGRGVGQDDAEAVRWHRLAAEQGHAVAQAAIARIEKKTRKKSWWPF